MKQTGISVTVLVIISTMKVLMNCSASPRLMGWILKLTQIGSGCINNAIKESYSGSILTAERVVFAIKFL